MIFPRYKIKMIQITIIMILFLRITSGDISNCQNGDFLTNSACFNNIIKLDNYRAGQFAEDKDGNIFILYSHSINKEKRLFYGLKSNGINYFEEGVQIETQIDFSGYNGERDGARVIFVNINLDGTNKQYLFSISAGDPANSLAELYEIKENGISSSSNTIEIFFQMNDEITSYQHSLIKQPKYLLFWLRNIELFKNYKI